ncbi:MAG: RNA polymerase sigma factor [Bacteroidota bacterium]
MTQVTLKLLRACRKKDRRAQSMLYEHCFGFLMPVAMRYANCEDDARAYLNMGFYKILKKLDQLKDINAFQGWAKRVLITTILDQLRKEKRYTDKVLHTEDSQGEEIPDAWLNESDIDAEEIYAAIRSLPPMTASVFNMYAIDGYKQKEIAELLKIQLGTVKWHYAEARKRLKARLSHMQERITTVKSLKGQTYEEGRRHIG